MYIHILDTPIKRMKKVKRLENGLNLPKHMAEQVYMFTGESAKKYLLINLFDWFGKEMQLLDAT